MKTWHFIALACIGALAPAAFADRTDTVLSSTAQITRFGAERLPDAGWRVTACGEANKTDGGLARLEANCVDCYPGGLNGLVATCLPAWRAANGL